MQPESLEVLRHAITEVEAKIHKGGWDANPMLLAMEYLKDRNNALAVSLVPLEIPGKPSEFLNHFAQTLAAEPELAKTWLNSYDTFYGLVLVCEGWSTPELPAATELSEAVKGYRGIADMPGAREVRMVKAMDLFGQYITVSRIRGEQPVCWDSTDTSREFRGEIPRVLRRLLINLARHLPDGDQYIQLLGKLRLSDPV